MFEKLKNGERHLRCLDWDKIGAEMQILGDESDKKRY